MKTSLISIYANLSDIVNFDFNLGEKSPNPRCLKKKILKSLHGGV